MWFLFIVDDPGVRVLADYDPFCSRSLRPCLPEFLDSIDVDYISVRLRIRTAHMHSILSQPHTSLMHAYWTLARIPCLLATHGLHLITGSATSAHGSCEPRPVLSRLTVAPHPALAPARCTSAMDLVGVADVIAPAKPLHRCAPVVVVLHAHAQARPHRLPAPSSPSPVELSSKCQRSHTPASLSCDAARPCSFFTPSPR